MALRQPRLEYTAEDTMRELSTLILTWAMQERQQQKKLDWQEKVTRETREYNATVSMYQDAKQESRDAELAYNKIEDEWRETGIGLEKLNELFATDESMKVLQDITEIPAKDYKKREQFYSNKAYNLERKADLIKDVLYDDIRKAKNVMSGGADKYGGTDALEWDKEDLGLKSFKELYGEASQYTEAYYEANPALVRASLDKLHEADLTEEIKREKSGYYKRLGLAATDKAASQHKEKIGKYFSSRLASGKERSEYNNYQAQNLMLATMMDNPDDYEQTDKDEKEALVVNIRNNIGVKYGILMGETDMTDEKASAYFDQYNQMHKLAKAKAATHLGVVSDPDFIPYWNAIEKAYETFESEDDSTRRMAMEQTAQQLFGFHESFDEFVGRMRQFKTDYSLAPFKGSNQTVDEDEDLDNDLKDLEDTEWDEILSD